MNGFIKISAFRFYSTAASTDIAEVEVSIARYHLSASFACAAVDFLKVILIQVNQEFIRR